jgi:hypothetical protein
MSDKKDIGNGINGKKLGNKDKNNCKEIVSE